MVQQPWKSVTLPSFVGRQELRWALRSFAEEGVLRTGPPQGSFCPQQGNLLWQLVWETCVIPTVLGQSELSCDKCCVSKHGLGILTASSHCAHSTGSSCAALAMISWARTCSGDLQC